MFAYSTNMNEATIYNDAIYIYMCVCLFIYYYYYYYYYCCYCCYRDPTKSCLSHSFRFPRLWMQHQEVMPKSCLLVFPHCERKRQNSPFQIGTFHFRFFFSCLPLRFNISYLPTFFPKQVYLYGVLSKNSVNRYWVAMAPLHGKRPRQFVSSYSFERVAVLGRIILLLSPGLHSWHALRLRSGWININSWM